MDIHRYVMYNIKDRYIITLDAYIKQSVVDMGSLYE